jgi:hypothetical protein
MHTLSTHASSSSAPLAGRLAVIAAAFLAEAAHLAWEAAHGGIVSHHLLADPSLPALWNGWGLLVVPVLAWIASSRLVRPTVHGWRLRGDALLRLAGAMLAGGALAGAFAAGRSDVTGMLFIAIAASGLVLRVYRIEYLLGFVLGMAWTFGAVLPTLVGSVIALGSAAAWFGAWRLARHVMMRIRG